MSFGLVEEVSGTALRHALSNAIWDTMNEDPDFRSHGASEVSIVAPIYARLYNSWSRDFYRVDFEYDREGSDAAYKCSRPEIHGHNTKWKRPDVLVHRRGEASNHNLLVIEFKIGQDSKDDAEKVRHFMGDCKRYRFGATVNLHRDGDDHRWRWFTQDDMNPVVEPIPRH